MGAWRFLAAFAAAVALGVADGQSCAAGGGKLTPDASTCLCQAGHVCDPVALCSTPSALGGGVFEAGYAPTCTTCRCLACDADAFVDADSDCRCRTGFRCVGARCQTFRFQSLATTVAFYKAPDCPGCTCEPVQCPSGLAYNAEFNACVCPAGDTCTSSPTSFGCKTQTTQNGGPDLIGFDPFCSDCVCSSVAGQSTTTQPGTTTAGRPPTTVAGRTVTLVFSPALDGVVDGSLQLRTFQDNLRAVLTFQAQIDGSEISDVGLVFSRAFVVVSTVVAEAKLLALAESDIGVQVVFNSQQFTGRLDGQPEPDDGGSEGSSSTTTTVAIAVATALLLLACLSFLACMALRLHSLRRQHPQFAASETGIVPNNPLYRRISSASLKALADEQQQQQQQQQQGMPVAGHASPNGQRAEPVGAITGGNLTLDGQPGHGAADNGMNHPMAFNAADPLASTLIDNPLFQSGSHYSSQTSLYTSEVDPMTASQMSINISGISNGFGRKWSIHSDSKPPSEAGDDTVSELLFLEDRQDGGEGADGGHGDDGETSHGESQISSEIEDTTI